MRELTRSVFAVFQTDEAGAYAVYVSARYDMPLHSIAATAHGEFEINDREYYYVAIASEDAAHAGRSLSFVVDDSLAFASLRATLRVVSCTNEDGRMVTDARCPVGQQVLAEVNWQSSGEIEQLGPVDVAGIHPGRGRQGTATGTIGSIKYATSTYALIVENRTYQS